LFSSGGLVQELKVEMMRQGEPPSYCRLLLVQSL
jgi:hypothetical protein